MLCVILILKILLEMMVEFYKISFSYVWKLQDVFPI